MDPLFMHDRYVLRRKVFKFLGGEFHLFGSDGQKLLTSKQKAFKLKEDIRVFDAQTPQRELLTIMARQVLDFGASYDVTDPSTGEMVGSLRRSGFKSMIRDEWRIFDPAENEVGVLQEDNQFLALVRRFLTNLLPQTFTATVNGQTAFEFRQHFNPFVYKLSIDFNQPAAGLLDRRLGIAAAILICAIEGRQD